MIRMTGYRILVKPDPLERQTKSGIYLARNEKLERSGIQRGVIIDIGESAWKAYREVDGKGNEHNGEAWAKVGDYVLFGKNAGRFIEDPFEPANDDDDLYLVMNDEDIIAIIKEGKNPVVKSVVQEQVIELGD